jgi:hypothetical protein
MLSIAASHPKMTLKTRDMDQAYTQSDTRVNRKVVVEVPEELDLDDPWVLFLVIPLYGLGEAGLHWFVTFFKYHKVDLGMSPSTLDTCLLYKREIAELEALVSVQVDDSMALGNAAYFAQEEQKVTRFQHKAAKTLMPNSPITFNGATIHQDHRGLKLVQEEHVRKLLFEENPANFTSVRALGSYVTTMSRPDILANFQLLSGIAALTKTNFLRLKATCTRATSSTDQGLSFVELDLSGPLKLVVFSDAGFNTNPDHTSQIGYVVALVDQNDKANVIAYTSKKCRRVTRSVFSAELLAQVLTWALP